VSKVIPAKFKVKIYSHEHLLAVIAKMKENDIVSPDFFVYDSKRKVNFIVLTKKEGEQYHSLSRMHEFCEFPAAEVWAYQHLKTDCDDLLETSIDLNKQRLRSLANSIYNTNLEKIGVDDIEEMKDVCCKLLREMKVVERYKE
jgi:hypothetical protein